MRRWGSRCSAALAAAVLAYAVLVAVSCDDDGAGPDDAGLSDISVQVMEGYIAANLQPVVPPDPIICVLTLRIVNNSATVPFSGLSIPSATVFRSKNSTELGTIHFQSPWDGLIGVGGIDTVVVTKVQEGQEIFPPPCGENVYLRAKIVKSAVQSKTFSTPAYGFSCPVARKDG